MKKNLGNNKHQELKNSTKQNNKLLFACLLNFSITLVQIVGALLSNSLALLSDAFHNFGDSLSLLIAFIAEKIGGKAPDLKMTYGYKRVELLAAFINSIILIIICIFLFFEAYKRLFTPEEVKGELMLVVAFFGLFANLISVVILHKDKSKKLNTKAAYLHLLSDTLSSFAVIVGGVLMLLFQIYWIDAIITLIISLHIFINIFQVLKETLQILLLAAPKEIDINLIKTKIESLQEIDNIHKVHFWKFTESDYHFDAHISLNNDLKLNEMMKIKSNIENLLRSEFKIIHTTLQIGYKCCNGYKDLLFK